LTPIGSSLLNLYTDAGYVLAVDKQLDLIDEPISYRLKSKLLGRPLANDQLIHERLGRPTALAVFASDALSSTAYATEEIIRALLLGGVGIAAFGFVMPITFAMVGVLVILMFSYRQTIKAYPSAGGAYIVTKDNMGLLPAQVAGVALLTDYILTVSVSVSAGVAALYSAFPVLYGYRVILALSFIAIITWGNLRGVKESARLFATPTYFFLVSMATMIGLGVAKALAGNLDPITSVTIPAVTRQAGLFLILHAFASGGAAMTGIEAISNGVPAFKPPEWKNARSTLMVMGAALGTMFIGVSWLAHVVKPIPTESKTVISLLAGRIYGTGSVGHAMFLFTQGTTMLILVLAANTSFADFPRLASFQASDAFLPKQLTKRGHRLVFSNGIIALAIAASVLVVVFRADVTHLIPLYAIGVFTSFTLSQAGMAKHHVGMKDKGWRLGLLINGVGAIVTGVVTIVIGVTKFSHGAWFIMILVPVMVAGLVKLHHQYDRETKDLSHDVRQAIESRVMNRLVALVLVGNLDRSVAAGLQYARSIRPDELRAVHVAVDPNRADELCTQWLDLNFTKIPLDLINCPDRRLERAIVGIVQRELAYGDTEVSVVIPRLHHTRWWHRMLHDRTGNSIASELAGVKNANVTFVPFVIGGQQK
jgi:amino acid transporter